MRASCAGRKVHILWRLRRGGIGLMACISLSLLSARGADAFVQINEPPIVTTIGSEIDDSVAEVLRRKDGRVSTLVKVNGQGPFPFIVDTGANRSSIGEALALALQLPTLEDRVVNGVTGAQLRKVVRAESLNAGTYTARGLQMPVIENVILGGSQGLLAASELKGQRIVLDFDRERYEVTKSRTGTIPIGALRLRARIRFGHLVETPCRISGIMARCIIDTGAEYTLLNLAMLDRLSRSGGTKVLAENVNVYGATDTVLTGTIVRLDSIQLGDLQFSNSAALASDAHIFQVWGIAQTPAVLLGMNVLRACDFLAIDFPQRALYIKASR